VNNGTWRDGQLEVRRKGRNKQFVCQHPTVLRVIPKFNDVEMFVGTHHQLGLATPAHATDMENCFETSALSL